MANVRDMGSPARLGTKSIIVNGTYNASSDNLDGYSQVNVDVPQEATLGTKSITANGTYNASSDSLDGYSQVSVAVPAPVLGTKNITANGTYTASADNLDGFSAVTVAVPSGAGATITVSYSSAFYDKTMTCTKGGTTYTETTTSAGTTVFTVNDSGTWTITCNGVSRTVDVVLEYTTQMAITQTVTVYSAASDTVSFTDVTGAKTVTTDTSGQGSVSITFIPPSQNITFTSSIAKNPNNLSQYYSKTVTVNSDTTEVYVMPDNALYWWGYESSDLENVTSANGWSYSGISTLNAPTRQTHYLDCTVNSTSTCYVAKKTKVSNGTVVKAITQGVESYSGKYGFILSSANKAIASPTYYDITDSSLSLQSTTTSAEVYTCVGVDIGVSGENRGVKLYAVWFE